MKATLAQYNIDDIDFLLGFCLVFLVLVIIFMRHVFLCIFNYITIKPNSKITIPFL